MSAIVTKAASSTLTLIGSGTPLQGEVAVPGDKSISHRAVILGALGSGTTRIHNFLPANDCLATLAVMQALGVVIEYSEEDVLVHGRGLHGLREPAAPLDCGGSGTTMRLMAGVLAGQPFASVLAGNEQLSRRPMDRVVRPLSEMGAKISGRDGGNYAPLSISGGDLRAITYPMPVASAQVKSAILLAGLFAEGTTEVVEPEGMSSRDHTERMLASMGARVTSESGRVQIVPPEHLNPMNIDVPGDISSAAFLLAAAAVVPGSRIRVTAVGVNPGRVGILNALERMGLHLVLSNHALHNGEPVADLEAAYAPLHGISITAQEVPGMVDELPVLAVVATQSEGVTEVRGAGELRVKETDRIATTVSELTRMGAKIEALPDGFRVEGPTRLHGAQVSSHGDHRLAMALAVAALAAEGETTIEETACIDDSFPGFERVLATLQVGDRLGRSGRP